MENSSCPYCCKNFSRKDNLNRHLKTEHKMQSCSKERNTETLYKEDRECWPHLKEEDGEESNSVDRFISLEKQHSMIEPRYQNLLTQQKYKKRWIDSGEDLNNLENIQRYENRLLHPFTCMIAGPSSSGKSSFVKKFIDQITDLMYPLPEEITWCYSEWQPLYETLPEVVFQKGIPNFDDFDPERKHLVILDDLMTECNDRVVETFTKKSHHRNISVMYLVQNVFYQGKGSRTISLNCHYMVLFKNPRDSSQIMHLAKQMYPANPKYLHHCYTQATEDPHGYLFIDLKQTSPEIMRLRQNIFPGEKHCCVFYDKAIPNRF